MTCCTHRVVVRQEARCDGQRHQEGCQSPHCYHAGTAPVTRGTQSGETQSSLSEADNGGSGGVLLQAFAPVSRRRLDQTPERRKSPTRLYVDRRRHGFARLPGSAFWCGPAFGRPRSREPTLSFFFRARQSKSIAFNTRHALVSFSFGSPMLSLAGGLLNLPSLSVFRHTNSLCRHRS